MWATEERIMEWIGDLSSTTVYASWKARRAKLELKNALKDENAKWHTLYSLISALYMLFLRFSGNFSTYCFHNNKTYKQALKIFL